jgi:hypothetical protein
VDDRQRPSRHKLRPPAATAAAHRSAVEKITEAQIAAQHQRQRAQTRQSPAPPRQTSPLVGQTQSLPSDLIMRSRGRSLGLPRASCFAGSRVRWSYPRAWPLASQRAQSGPGPAGSGPGPTKNCSSPTSARSTSSSLDPTGMQAV